MGGTGGGMGGSGGSGGAIAPGAYGADCMMSSDCDSGLCGSFMMDTVHLCTKMCTTDADCPNGDKCSGMGQCNPLQKA
jgi:hypothetical protein